MISKGYKIHENYAKSRELFKKSFKHMLTKYPDQYNRDGQKSELTRHTRYRNTKTYFGCFQFLFIGIQRSPDRFSIVNDGRVLFISLSFLSNEKLLNQTIVLHLIKTYIFRKRHDLKVTPKSVTKLLQNICTYIDVYKVSVIEVPKHCEVHFIFHGFFTPGTHQNLSTIPVHHLAKLTCMKCL